MKAVIMAMQNFSGMHSVTGLLFCTILALGGCSGNKSLLAEDPTIQRIFNDEEIHDLEVILNFFESQICDLLQVHADSVQDCYQAFFLSVGTAERSGVIYIPVAYHDQLKMYDQLGPEAFTQIWIAGQVMDREPGISGRRVMLSYDGKYMQFLEALSNHYQILEAYRKSFAQEHRMSPDMINGVLYNYHLYNMGDIRMRLFVALHYLTLNAVFEQKGATDSSSSE